MATTERDELIRNHPVIGEVEFGIGEGNVPQTAHVAYFWETEKEFADGVRFLEAGLRGLDHCVIFGHEEANRAVCNILQSHGFDVKDLLAQQRITILGGNPSEAKILETIGGAFQQALAQGTPLIRLLGNIGWGKSGWPGDYDLLAFEAKVTAVVKEFPCVVLCMYDVAVLPGLVIRRGAYGTHPLIEREGSLQENPDYIPADFFLKHLELIADALSERRQAQAESRRANESLHRSETYLADAQRLSHMGSWAFNVTTREIVHWSQESFRIFGLDPKDGMPSFETLMQRIHPDDRTSTAEVIEIGIRERTDYEQAFRIVLPNGTTRYMHATGHPVFNSLGDPVEFMGSVIDVTERKRAEEARARQASVRADVSASLSRPAPLGETLQGAAEAIVRHLDAAFARIWTLNKEKNLLELRASAGMYTHLDGPHSRIQFGKLKIGLIAQDKRPHLTNDVLNDPRVSDKVWARNEGMVSFAGYPLIVQDRVVGVMAMFARHRLSATTLDALASIADSIAQGIERERTEEALRKSQAELAHVARVATLGEMSASIAHEVNQPLTAAVTSASACLRWLDAQKLEEARRSATRAIAEAHRASEIIGRIRSLAKKAPPQKYWLDVNETIHEVIALARSEIQRNNIALETQLSEHVPVILADRIELQQVILNLMMNAIEAMSGVDEGPRELLVRSGTDESQGVLVSVQDSGPGIDPKSLDRLFDAFYTTKPQGLGMGLAISRSIVEAHGGRLWAIANPDKGTTFQFTLPIGGGNQDD